MQQRGLVLISSAKVTKMDKVCMVVDLEGFTVDKRFYVRELGAFDWKGRRCNYKFFMPMPFESLSDRDRRSVRYVTRHVHGLPFKPKGFELAMSQEYVEQTLMNLYRRSKTETLDVVGYKGGHVEREVLRKLNIPYLDIEAFGCPKVEGLFHSGMNGTNGCGQHEGQVHCSTLECELFWWWVTDYLEENDRH